MALSGRCAPGLLTPSADQDQNRFSHRMLSGGLSRIVEVQHQCPRMANAQCKTMGD